MSSYGYTAPPASQYPQYPQQVAMSHEDAQQAKFAAIASRYEITDYYAKKMKQVEGFEIVLILDDSGSMNTPTKLGNASSKSVTRWEELKSSVGVIVDLASVMDKDGIDLYFLNRGTLKNVSDSSQVTNWFAQPAGGFTPLNQVLRKVIQDKKDIAMEKKLLIIIFTDGVPDETNEPADKGEKGIDTLQKILKKERFPKGKIYVTFFACTDDDDVMKVLNKCDKIIPNVDVVDDYDSERAEVLRAKGRDYKFTMGNYLVKGIIGSVDPEFDNMDEVHSCCSIQ